MCLGKWCTLKSNKLQMVIFNYSFRIYSQQSGSNPMYRRENIGLLSILGEYSTCKNVTFVKETITRDCVGAFNAFMNGLYEDDCR